MDGLTVMVIALVMISLIGLRYDRVMADHVLPHRQQDKNCVDGWVFIHRQCYKFMKMSRRRRLGWQAAKEACLEMEGKLSLFPSMNEYTYLDNYLQTHHKSDSFWIDLTKKNGTWRWGDNSEVIEKISPWKNANTKNRDGTPCGLATINKNTRKLSLSNSRCTSKKNYICERAKKQTTTDPPTQETTAMNNGTNNDVSTQATVTKSLSDKGATASGIHRQEKATQIADSQDVVSFTFPPKTKAITRIVTMKTGKPIPLILTPPVDQKEDVTRPTHGRTTPKQTTTHSEGFQIRTRRVTRFTTSDDQNDDESNSDDDTSFPGFQRKTTPARKFPDMTTVVSRGVNRFTPPLVSSETETNEEDGDDQTDVETGYETDDDSRESVKTSTKTTGRFRTSSLPTTLRTTTKRAWLRPRPSPRRNDRFWLEARREYDGCYIPGKKANARQTVLSARRLYQGDADHCPEVTISRLTFPQVESGETATARCRKGTGFATLECGEDTVCWQDQPDMSGCASPRFTALLKKIKEEQLVSILTLHNKTEDDEMMEESVNMTSELVSMTETDDISMEDILVTSEVLTAFTHSTENKKVKKRDRKAVRKIVGNVIKAGNNLFSRKRKAVWKEMAAEDKVRSASSLMVAMETATMSLAEKIEEPTVIKQVEENIEMEIQVVDVEKMEEKDQEEIVYETDQSDNSFSIPLENLKVVNEGGGSLDKVVFITHYSMADILDTGKTTASGNAQPDVASQDQSLFSNNNDTGIHVGEETVKKDSEESDNDEEDEDEDPAPQIASYILSASIGGSESHRIHLPKPVTFTMKHIMTIQQGYITLCSFWDVSQGSGQSFWSQEGCRVKKSNSSHTTCECDHMTSFAILMDIHGFEVSSDHQSYLRLITIIGCVISCFCLIVSWFTFQFCTALQGERNSIHKNLAACLLVSELLFVAGVTQTEHKITCSVIAVFLHFFFLSAFTWMFLEGLHIIFMLVQVFDASRSRLPHYYITGYGLPAVIVGISCLVYFPGYGTDSFCWLTTDRYFVWAFAGPVAVILVVNSVFLTYAMTTVCRHSDYVFSAKDGNAGSPIRSWIQGALAMEVLLGLTWVFGYFLLNANTLPLAYAFTILNSLQGLFIYIFHCLLNKKAQKEYRRVMRSSLGRLTSFASSQSMLGKRTNASTKSHEMGNSNSASRKLSLSYKHNNGNYHDNASKNNPPSFPNNGSVIASIDNSGDVDIV